MPSVAPPLLSDYFGPLTSLWVATLIGCLIGINRDLRGQPIGMRTLGMVSLGASVLALMVSQLAHAGGNAGVDAASRVIQGVVTGIGFLGAGVILRSDDGLHVRGLTTAATIWVTAALGIACGLGLWLIAMTATGLVLFLLVIGVPLEKAIHRRYFRSPDRRDAP